MDHSFSSYHYHLAQMPTDQREHEQHLSVQTGLSDTEDFLQANASQPYNPCAPVENWPAFGSNPAPESMISMIPLPHPGYSNPWGATMSEPYEPSSAHLSRALVPDHTHFSPYYSVPHHTMASMIPSPDSMDQLSPEAQKRDEHEDLWAWQAAPATPSTLAHGSFYHHPAQLETPKGNLTMRATPLSPISICSQSPSRSLDSMSPVATITVADSTSPRTSLGDHSDGGHNAEPPYSKLIYDALMSHEDKQMPLQDIYEWFAKNTSKGKDSSRGWQNSIRHNLSMNAGFEAVKIEGSGKKATNYWRLTQEAIDHGFQSTTRYRKANHRKGISSDPPALGRQRSGSKGGKATKNAAKMRHITQDEQRMEWGFPPTLHRQQHLQPQPMENHFHPTPSMVDMPPYQTPHTFNGLSPMPRDGRIQAHHMNTVIGCTIPPPGDNAVFCDTAETGPDYAAFDTGQLDWYELATGPNNGLMPGFRDPL